MILIKLERKTETKTDLIKSALKTYCQIKDIKLSEAEYTGLSFFIAYGLEKGKDMILETNIISRASYENFLSKMRKYKFIKRIKDEHFTDELVEEFKQFNTTGIAFLLKIV